ncbi:MAG: hypothetical protein AAGA80_18210 [Cyanobacteria bacterium P01_F01_bin.143]
MSGYWGDRPLGRFVERHQRELIKRLQIPKARVPSYSVIRREAGLASRNLSLLKTWVLTLLRTHGFDSIKSAISEMSHNLFYILSFCT